MASKPYHTGGEGLATWRLYRTEGRACNLPTYYVRGLQLQHLTRNDQNRDEANIRGYDGNLLFRSNVPTY